MDFWKRVLAFLRFDFDRAFSRRTISIYLDRNNTDLITDSSYVHFEPDNEKLTRIQNRRALLDWHDDFEIRFNMLAVQLYWSFHDHIVNKSNSSGFVGNIFAKGASEVLSEDFSHQVRHPLNQQVLEAESQLRDIVSRCLPDYSKTISLNVGDVEPTLSILGNAKLRTWNIKDLLGKIESLVFSKYGIVDNQIRRSLQVTGDLLKKMEETQ